ncbi:MAG: methionine--tRNA ligase [Bacilli bacterium]|nr:methionine--tRNA ligase [Bacilli bacterium]
MKNILIGISWPFANGDLHIGHAASSLPGDVIARYHRLKGNNVILVSGSDCHGTPIDVKALQEKKSAKEIVDLCHENFTRDWKNLGVSFDLYNRTDDEYHKDFVKEQFKKYYDYGYLYEQKEEQLFCEHCNLFLADRYIVGVCPKCGSDIKGDECEKCGSLLEIKDVKETKCAICGNKTSIKETKNLYFSLSRFQDNIKDLVSKNKLTWRENAILFTERYIKEGIPDRCASRSLNWGIDIPIKDYEDKKIYGWFENVWGYVTASKKYCEEHNLNWEDFWKNEKENKIYLVHAKDNIPFHTVIFPSLLLATKDNYKLPDKIVSDEYITIEGEKLSKSKGNYISVKDILERYPADAVRYYFLYNDPSKRDFNFTWNDFINSINGELLGKWGNFINRTLVFINKSFDGKLLNSEIDQEVEYKLKRLFETVGEDIDNGNVKEGLIKIFDFISYANKYFDEKEPWKLAKENIDECNKVLLNCVNIILNVNILLKPYLPFSCEKVEEYLNKKTKNWNYTKVNNIEISKEIKPLYERYDKSRIDEEIFRLKNNI